MRIRCERCATTYELDERRLPPHGALVKCTRCDHVFRAAPPAGSPRPEPDPGRAPEAVPGDRVNGEERTALFGFSSPGGEDGTASIPAASAPPAGPSTLRGAGATAGAVAPSRSGKAPRPAEGGGGRTWWWVLLAAILAAAVLGGGYWLAQRKAATPTTRLPAGAELFPT